MPKKKSEHYVNNKELLEALIEQKLLQQKSKDFQNHALQTIWVSAFLRLRLICHTNQIL